ncbi:MAG TPA: glycosyltransferase [Verrucomicrobiae bacterium]
MPAISVIICTHNPREDYLKRVLDALRAQTLAKDQWELLLIDNASAKTLSQTWDLSWHPQARHVREEKLGLTPARLSGIASAKGELLVFVDDDNVLRGDYLQNALKIGGDYPWLGAWSGSCLAEFETTPAAELGPWLGGLVIETIQVPVWAKLPKLNTACPAGGGMVVRHQQASLYRDMVLKDPVRQALDRCGKQLGSGGDSDMVLSGFQLGYGAGKFPELEMTHLIPPQRLTLPYLEGLYEGFGHAGVILDYIYHAGDPIGGGNRFGGLRCHFKRFLWLLAGKPPVERRIRYAIEKGRQRARTELLQAKQCLSGQK